MKTISNYINESKNVGKVHYNLLAKLYENLYLSLVDKTIHGYDIEVPEVNKLFSKTVDEKKKKILGSAIKQKYLKNIAHAAIEASVISAMPTELSLSESDNKTFILQVPENKDSVDIVYKYADETISFEVKSVTKYNNLMFTSENQKNGTDYVIAVLYSNSDKPQIKDIQIINNSNKPEKLHISTDRTKNGIN